MATEPGERIRIAIVDDNDEVRRMLHTMLDLENRFDVVGEAADGDEAIALADSHPDVMLLDLMMPIKDGLTALPEILASSPETKVVVFTAAGASYAHAAMTAGAHACIEKTRGFDELLATILRVWDSAKAS